MSVKGITVLNGQMHYKGMATELCERDYAIHKANIWMHMLNEGKRPTRWLKANSKGTKVNFDFINKQEQYDVGVAELKLYLTEINNEYDLEFTLNH